MFLEQRTKPLTVICPGGSQEELLEICRLGYETLLDMIEFPLEFIEVESGENLQMNGLTWQFAQTLHPRKNLAVRLDKAGGKSLAYSGDGDITRSAKELYFGLDCLIHDAYSFEPLEEIHTQIDDTVALAKDQQVKKLFLTHLKRKERSSKAFHDLVQQVHEKVEIFAPLPGEEFRL
jgi:ribonuclease BN (tRNA processing enzyme)